MRHLGSREVCDRGDIRLNGLDRDRNRLRSKIGQNVSLKALVLDLHLGGLSHCGGSLVVQKVNFVLTKITHSRSVLTVILLGNKGEKVLLSHLGIGHNTYLFLKIDFLQWKTFFSLTYILIITYLLVFVKCFFEFF